MEQSDLEIISDIFNELDNDNFLVEYNKIKDNLLIEERFSVSFFLINNNNINIYNLGSIGAIDFLEHELRFFNKNSLVPPVEFNALFISILSDCIIYGVDLPEDYNEEMILKNIEKTFYIYNSFINFPIIKENAKIKEEIDFQFLTNSFLSGIMDLDHEKFFFNELKKNHVNEIFNNFLNKIINNSLIPKIEIIELMIEYCKEQINIDTNYINKNIKLFKNSQKFKDFIIEKENENLNKKIKEEVSYEILQKQTKNKRKL